MARLSIIPRDRDVNDEGRSRAGDAVEAWNLAEAKNRLSEVLDRARRDGPQTIRRRGEVFVLLSADRYEKLTGQKPSFTDWLLNGPRLDQLDIPRRGGSPMREISL